MEFEPIISDSRRLSEIVVQIVMTTRIFLRFVYEFWPPKMPNFILRIFGKPTLGHDIYEISGHLCEIFPE